MHFAYKKSTWLLIACYYSCLTNVAITDSITERFSNGNENHFCPRKCDCNYELKEVACRYKRLVNIPKGIPPWTSKLSLTGNHIRRISPSFSNILRHIEELHLDGNHLKKLSPRSFNHAKKLRKLNLSSNRISSLPKGIFKKLQNLEVLLLSHNKFGKINLGVFEGLNNIIELRIDNNHLQTLEPAVFENMTLLKMLYMHGNKWHCDCQLKKMEFDLRDKEIKYGYIICDSPIARKRQILKDVVVMNLCGPDVEKMVGALLGITSGLIVFLFTIFMCRKAANFIAEKELVEQAANINEEDADFHKSQGESVRSSFISVV